MSFKNEVTEEIDELRFRICGRVEDVRMLDDLDNSLDELDSLRKNAQNAKTHEMISVASEMMDENQGDGQ